ncbi:porin [Simplicispira hankyongi]|jgi:predicted porin|uniref:Porin n=1 Tax=Simplicispira hankyongi TaxID=2315688 RepID=A0A398CC54_9BURK|nr:porin [Simplicispira hankyongi]RID98518.1 porin [Simplicispira hankyongi]
MKKSLIALAVLAASGAAMAQSSVTMYGVADLSLAKASGVSAQMSGNGLMNNGNSRLGVRGVEDLGGGLKASFNFEQGINAESGATDAATYQRAAWLALSGGFGRFQMGRTLNPSFYGVAAWELTGTANYSVVGNQFGFTGEGPRTNSVFQYTTPNMGGFSGTIGYTAKPDNSGNAKTDLNLIYANGPIAAALSYNKTNTLKSNVALGGSYDFGMFKLAGSLQDDKQINAKGFTLGGTVPVGPVALTLDIARQTNSGFKNTDVLLEAKYALSKRTFTYATYYKDGADDAGNYKTGAKNTFGLGVRHNF